MNAVHDFVNGNETIEDAPTPVPTQLPFSLKDILALMEIAQRTPKTMGEQVWFEGLQEKIMPMLEKLQR